MTIVLQHQFWDLSVTEHTLEVGLSFSGVPERLLIPFDALTGFFDPSVQFGLKFELQEPPACRQRMRRATSRVVTSPCCAPPLIRPVPCAAPLPSRRPPNRQSGPARTRLR